MTDHAKRVEDLRENQKKLNDLRDIFNADSVKLEAEYQERYKFFYKERYDIVNGLPEIKADKGVPKFWLNAMKSNEVLAKNITKKDEDSLKYLKDITWCRIDTPKGFKLEFDFDERNPFFYNSALTLTYQMLDDDEPILEKIIGTEIKWKLLLEKKRKRESFFNFFNLYEKAAEDSKEFQEKMAQNYDIGSTIRDKIIPNAVLWFTGEAVHPEYEDMDYEDMDYEKVDPVEEAKEETFLRQRMEILSKEMKHNIDCEECELEDLSISLPQLTWASRAAAVENVRNCQKWFRTRSNWLSLNATRDCVMELKRIQKEHDLLKEKFLVARAGLEAKYHQNCEPLYKTRFNIVSGVSKVDEVMKEVEAEVMKEVEADNEANKGTEGTINTNLVSGVSKVDEVMKEVEADKEADKGTEEKGVLNFWLKAMKNNTELKDKITLLDEAPLKYLEDIKWTSLKDTSKEQNTPDGFKLDTSKEQSTPDGSTPDGFKLDFHFSNNPYFSNPVLTKAYHVADCDELILKEVKGTEIEWHVGMPNKSFFNIFTDYSWVSEEAAEDLKWKFDQDFDICAVIRDKIIPNAVLWFTGDARDVETSIKAGKRLNIGDNYMLQKRRRVLGETSKVMEWDG